VNSEAKDNTPLISVIVPCYNVAPYLRQCIESILAQSFERLEVIAVNDGSTDDTLALLEEYAASRSKVRIIDKQNEGYGASCNRGIAEAKGEWISIVEPDDWIEPGMYEQMVSFATCFSPAPEVIKTPYWRIINPDTPRQRRYNCSYRHRIKPSQQPFTVLEAPHLLSHHPSIWSALYRREFLEKHRIAFKPIPGAGWADNPFLLETLLRAEAIAYLDIPFYCYREESPEKLASFYQSNPLVPFERWLEQQSVIDELKVTDAQILRTQNRRGFTYLANVLKVASVDENQALRGLVAAMFERMDSDLVLSDPAISPGLKKLFLKLRELPQVPVKKLPSRVFLLKEGLYSLYNVGPVFTLKNALGFLDKK
jgi:glycosyltransferase involved in cell wall biosynthesis